MLRAAAALWLGALVMTTTLLVVVVSAQQVARWVRRLRPAPARVDVLSVPGQRVHPNAPERAAA